MTTFDGTRTAPETAPSVLTAPPAPSDGPWVHEVELDGSWMGMGGILGGKVAATAAEVSATLAPGRHLRTATTSFLRPTAPGLALITVERPREGRALTTLEAEVSQGGRRTATVRMTFLADVPALSWEAPNPARLVARDACIPIAPPPQALHFAHNRFVLDPAFEPFSHNDVARVAGYVQPLGPRPIDAPWLVMVLDSFPPSPFTRHDPPTGGTSIDFTVHVHRTLPMLAADEWLTGEFEADISADGLALERGVIRDPAGRALAESFHTRWTAAG